MKYWILAARPKTLPAGASPVLLSLALSYHLQKGINFTAGIVTLACTVLLQISSNFINDYYDGIRGLDGEDRLGPKRATALGLITPVKMRFAFLLTLGLAFTLGLYLMILGGAPIVIIGLLSILFAWAYTGGPLPLSYIGLGEVFAFIFFGPVAVWGTYYLQTLELMTPASVFWAGIMLGLLSASLMGVNNLRDTLQDASRGKKTLSTLTGQSSMRKIIFSFILLSFIAHEILYIVLNLPLFTLFAPLVLMIIFINTWKQILYKATDSALNNTLANIGKYLFFNALMASILIISLG